VFLVVLGALDGNALAQRRIVRDLACILVGVSLVLLIPSGNTRVGSVFRNPNYAAHYLCCGLVVVIACWRARLRTKLALTGVVLLGCYLTGSFASAPFLAAAGGYWAWSSAGSLPRNLRTAARLVAVVGVLVVSFAAMSRVTTGDVDLGHGVSTARLDRSGSSRTGLYRDALRVWRHNPMGVGPEGIKGHNIELSIPQATEIHDDVLDTLVAGGVLALVGLVGMVSTLWRLTPAGSGSRALISGLIAASVFRQTWNFRHLWLLLAIVVAVDRLRAFHASTPPS
jgi:hypothetical protein